MTDEEFFSEMPLVPVAALPGGEVDDVVFDEEGRAKPVDMGFDFSGEDEGLDREHHVNYEVLIRKIVTQEVATAIRDVVRSLRFGRA